MAENPYSSSVAIFDDERVLKEDWQPDRLPEREAEIEDIRAALAPVTRGVNAHNLFVFGKTGQGKSVAIHHELNLLQEWAEEENHDLSVISISAQNQTTSYQLAGHLIKTIRGDKTKPSGIDQQSVFDMLYNELRDLEDTIIIVIDEIDTIGTSDDILYELPRARKNGNLREDQWISVIGISNDLKFIENLNPKVKSSLYDEEVEFTPYDANQLTTILERRADKAFLPGVLEDDVLPLCAAFAAQDEGSARQAIRILYKAGDLALREDAETVTEEHVRDARNILERKRVEESMRSLTTQDQVSFLAVVALEARNETPARTSEVYEQYKNIAAKIDTDILAERRIRDHLKELALQSFLESETKTGGIRGGDYHTFWVKVDLNDTIEILGEDTRIEDVVTDIKNTAQKSNTL